MLQPKHLVFAGGGPKCISFLGALEILYKKNIFSKTSHYWGNSAGAIVATFIKLKVPLPRLYTIFEKIDFTRFRDIDLANIVTFGEKWGLDSGEGFVNHIKELLEIAQPGSSHYTLQELPGLHIASADLTDTKMVILDSTTFPTLKLIDALRASTSIPFFYRPFRNPINNHLMVDGGLGANFPWMLLPSDEERSQALGFNFKKSIINREPQTLSEYIPKILNFRELSRLTDKKPYQNEPNIINFDIIGYPSWHLGIKQNDKDELIAIGKMTAEKWLNSYSVEEKIENQHMFSDLNTQLTAFPSSKLSSENHVCQPQKPHLDSPQGSPSLYSPPSRRWSV
jgi:predicted acylesterase/phospholipase RssA